MLPMAFANWLPADHFGLWQLVVSVFGFALAIIQLWRTANATVASKNLLAKRLISNDLLALMPELHTLEDNIDVAVKSGDEARVETALVAWFRSAGRIQGYLEARADMKEELVVKLLRQSVKATRSAKIEITEGLNRPLVDVVRLPRDKIVKVTTEVTSLVGRLQKDSD